MVKQNHVITRCLERWRTDLRELTVGVFWDPFAEKHGRRWDRDFVGEISNPDIYYAVFLGVLSVIPAAVVAYTSSAPQWKVMAQFFRAPLQAVISGFLTAALIFLGSHVNRVAKPFPTAFKLMLRIMSIHPILGFLSMVPPGEVAALLVYGFFVVRGVKKTYAIPLRNALLFFGVVYVVFALLQLQSLLGRPPTDHLKYFSATIVREDAHFFL